MRTIKLVLPAAILMSGFLLCTTAGLGRPQYAQKEKKGCTFCHVKAGSKDLNDTGKYYQEHNHSLDGYEKK
jgi:hypothetical protein